MLSKFDYSRHYDEDFTDRVTALWRADTGREMSANELHVLKLTLTYASVEPRLFAAALVTWVGFYPPDEDFRRRLASCIVRAGDVALADMSLSLCERAF